MAAGLFFGANLLKITAYGKKLTPWTVSQQSISSEFRKGNLNREIVGEVPDAEQRKAKRQKGLGRILTGV